MDPYFALTCAKEGRHTPHESLDPLELIRRLPFRPLHPLLQPVDLLLQPVESLLLLIKPAGRDLLIRRFHVTLSPSSTIDQVYTVCQLSDPSIKAYGLGRDARWVAISTGRCRRDTGTSSRLGRC